MCIEGKQTAFKKVETTVLEPDKSPIIDLFIDTDLSVDKLGRCW